MSISLALIPLVLLLRVTMGKDNFENWVDSTQIKIPTNIKNENELIFAINKSEYDIIKFGNIYKTHMNEDREFFFWEKINGVWTAVFSTYDSQENIKTFISTVERRLGKKIIEYNLENIKTSNEISIESKTQEEVFPTNFVDEDLLLQTLRDHGVNVKMLQDRKIKCNIENYTLTFYKENNSNYELKINGASSLKNIYKQLNELDEEYKRNVQSYTYNKVIDKLKKNNMKIESEEVLEDDSLLLTININ